MLNIVNNHPRFVLDNIKTEACIKDFKEKKWDWMDKQNDGAAQTFLINSLDPSLQLLIEGQFRNQKPTFAQSWLALAKDITTSSSERYDRLRLKLEKLQPQHFPGQDMKAFSATLELASVDLISSGFYKPETTKKILINASKADAPIDYMMAISEMKLKLNKAISHTISMDASKRDAHLLSEGLDLGNVLRSIKDNYSNALDSGEWAPAKGKGE